MQRLLGTQLRRAPSKFCSILSRRFGHSEPIKLQNARAVCRGFDRRNPFDAVSVEKETLEFDPNSSEFSDKVLLKTRVACIHPADVNTLQGVYGSLPEFPFVPGLEGLFEVVASGKNVRNARFRVGSLVAPICSAQIGAWQQYVVADTSSVVPLRVSGSALHQSLTQFQLAQLSINPCTAYRMLYDFVHLEPGDFVVQNAANSAVGESVIQIAHTMGLRTINIVRGSEKGSETRSEEEFAYWKQHLRELGADVVVGSEDLALMSSKERSVLYGSDESKKPRLALNCVGGNITKLTQKLLGKKGTMVTIGNMAKEPVVAGTASLIFHNHSYTGFWISTWCEENSAGDYEKMLLEMKDMAMNGDLKLDFRLAKFGANGEGFDCALRCALGLEPLDFEYKAHMVNPRDFKTSAVEGDDAFIETKGKVLLHFDDDWLKTPFAAVHRISVD